MFSFSANQHQHNNHPFAPLLQLPWDKGIVTQMERPGKEIPKDSQREWIFSQVISHRWETKTNCAHVPILCSSTPKHFTQWVAFFTFLSGTGVLATPQKKYYISLWGRLIIFMLILKITPHLHWHCNFQNAYTFLHLPIRQPINWEVFNPF